jgi:methylated-DNA-[protein]-cysteine S-methyltransferase
MPVRTDRVGSLSWTAVSSVVGPLTIVATGQGLLRLSFGAPGPVLAEFAGAAQHPDAGVAAEVGAQVIEYFDGHRRHFDVPIDWSTVQGFRLHVLRTLYEQVPFGRTVSYRELAELSGRPTAARTVGAIMGSNPVPLVVPCHRVVASGGGMGGFGPGIEAKRRLLVLEGVLSPTLLDQ